MERFFNTTGPCNPTRHYMLPPEARMPALSPMVEQDLYFVVHAARQTGKTTAMQAFAARLCGQGHVGLWATLETSQGADEDVAEPRWLSAIDIAAKSALPPELQPPAPATVAAASPGSRLNAWLRSWCEKVAPRKVILLLDEADVVRGPAVVNLLRQLRGGFQIRGPGVFPTSLALIGMRDLRDYLTAAKDGVAVNPGSPFNIKVASITLRNFLASEVVELYGQHTAETGQVFTADASERAYYWTEGQPFLVNALARIVTQSLVVDRSETITAAHIDVAKEELLLSRTTHLDALAERLKEPRVARIVEPILLGDTPFEIPYDHDDFSYVIDLGLVKKGPLGAEAANPLYREVLVRQIGYNVQEALPRPWWRWQTPEGKLDFPALLEAFRQWWREHEEILQRRDGYLEAVAHVAFMAFLGRVVNGGGTVQREYAAGRGAVDLLVTYAGDRFVVELKRVHARGRSAEKVRAEGVTQLGRYLETLGESRGWLLIFDQRPGRSWEERLWAEDVEVGGKRIFLRGA